MNFRIATKILNSYFVPLVFIALGCLRYFLGKLDLHPVVLLSAFLSIGFYYFAFAFIVGFVEKKYAVNYEDWINNGSVTAKVFIKIHTVLFTLCIVGIFLLILYFFCANNWTFFPSIAIVQIALLICRTVIKKKKNYS